MPYLIRRAASHFPTQPAISCRDRVYTVGQVYERACRLANALAAAGCRPGDRVGVYVANCAEYMEIDFGLALGGFVRVALNVRLGVGDQAHVLEDARARGLIYGPDFGEQVRELLDVVPGIDVVLRMSHEQGPGVPYEDVLVRASSADPGVALTSEDLCSLFYTSGTSGRPKGVKLSHRAQVAVALGLLLEFPIRRGEKILLPQPLSHGAGFFMLPYYISGCQCVVLPKFEAATTLQIAAEQSIETIKLVPAMLGQLLQSAPRWPELPALRRIIYGAAPMPPHWLIEGLERFGPVFAQLYGQAESPMCITVLPEADHDLDRPSLLSSAGRPWLSADVRVVGPDGEEVRPGETGEVVVRAATTMSGYWNMTKETAEVLVDGRLHTRDLATVDDRGYLYLLGRSDEMINSGGFMIAPRAVEDVLHQHAAILEAAVIGIPDPVWGEAVKAIVVARPGATVTAEDIIAFCRDRLGFQRPRYVEIRPELPKNAYGKVLKKMLREQRSSQEG